MNEVQVFKHERFGEIRTINEDETLLFCATDICNALGYANTRDAIATHVEDPDVAKRYTGVETGIKADGTPAIQNVEMTYVTEPGLYSLIFGSKLPQAKQFKRWVFTEVLPAIRRTGRYEARGSENPVDLKKNLLKRKRTPVQMTDKQWSYIENMGTCGNTIGAGIYLAVKQMNKRIPRRLANKAIRFMTNGRDFIREFECRRKDFPNMALPEYYLHMSTSMAKIESDLIGEILSCNL